MCGEGGEGTGGDGVYHLVGPSNLIVQCAPVDLGCGGFSAFSKQGL